MALARDLSLDLPALSENSDEQPTVESLAADGRFAAAGLHALLALQEGSHDVRPGSFLFLARLLQAEGAHASLGELASRVLANEHESTLRAYARTYRGLAGLVLHQPDARSQLRRGLAAAPDLVEEKLFFAEHLLPDTPVLRHPLACVKAESSVVPETPGQRQQSDLNVAAGYFNDVLASDPNSGRARLGLALALKAKGEVRAAIAAFQEVARRHPATDAGKSALAHLIHYAALADCWEQVDADAHRLLVQTGGDQADADLLHVLALARSKTLDTGSEDATGHIQEIAMAGLSRNPGHEGLTALMGIAPEADDDEPDEWEDDHEA